jgi:hypothetical protein
MTGRVFRKSRILLAATTLTMFLAACGGGGGATSAGGAAPGAPVGPATVEITFTAAPVTGSAAPLVAVDGPSTVPTPDPAYKWPWEIQEPSPRIEHVFMEVVKVSLMPAEEAFDSEDMEGEMQDGNSPDPPSPAVKPHFVTTVVDPPVFIDLLRLENGKRLARILNRFDQVHAGTYDKIRIYYRNVKVVLEDGTKVNFHPTSHSKFDIHFRQGHELVIPVTTDTTQKPDGWVKFFRVEVDFVGLKIRIVNQGKSWKGSKVILRPQIFAVGGNDILYSVAGTADNVDTLSGTFDIFFGAGPRIIPVVFGADAKWAYSDNVLGHSPWIVNDIPSATAAEAFRDTATVMAIGSFDTSLTLLASDIVFSFPVAITGTADNVWLPPDNVAFIVRTGSDNVAVFPRPDRFTAYYDNAVSHDPLDQSAIDNGVRVKARGYFRTPSTEGIDAYWISIGGIAP